MSWKLLLVWLKLLCLFRDTDRYQKLRFTK